MTDELRARHLLLRGQLWSISRNYVESLKWKKKVTHHTLPSDVQWYNSAIQLNITECVGNTETLQRNTGKHTLLVRSMHTTALDRPLPDIQLWCFEDSRDWLLIWSSTFWLMNRKNQLQSMKPWTIVIIPKSMHFTYYKMVSTFAFSGMMQSPFWFSFTSIVCCLFQHVSC